ncbi:MAG: hypothetical protein J4F36_02405 [Nitrosopumilaceae archaeon]|nr:hypothetical protein [Nitrosopumilaceae archaeon]
MNLLGVSLIVGFTILFSVLAVDDAFGTFRESRNTIKINQTNEYANYVHFQPEWKSYPRNLIVDVTTTWEREVIPGEEQQSDISKHGAKQRQNGLQYINSKPVVAVQYDYRDCESQWFHYAKTSLDFLGYQLDMFRENDSIPNSAYSDESQKQKLQNGFAQFVPICTSKESTNYKYDVSVNDDTIGFDVYFVPSYVQQWYYFLYPANFEYYSDDGCFANNYQKFSGQCNGIDKNGGLLIVIPDELSRPMTKISVKLTET